MRHYLFIFKLMKNAYPALQLNSVFNMNLFLGVPA